MKTIDDTTISSPAVYSIVDPNTEQMYIGSTNNLNRRRHEHLKLLKDNNHYNNSLQNNYNNDESQLLFHTPTKTREEAYQLEQKMIDKFKDSHLLLNIASDVKSSRKGAVLSDKTKELIKIASTGRKLSDETKEKIRQANIGKTISAEHKSKLLASNIGRNCSDETREKMRQSKLDNTYYNVEAARLSNIGRKMPDNTRAAIREANLGRKMKPELKQKIIECNNKPVVVNGILYDNCTSVSKDFNVAKSTVTNRCNSSKFPNWSFHG